MLKWVDLDPLDGLHTEVSLFWTGGLGSTFRLIELVRAGVDVQPIYLSAVLDLRRSQHREKAVMSELTERVRERYPEGGKLREVMVVDTVPDNAWVEQQARTLSYGPSRRTAMDAQWVGLCRFAEAHHAPIEVGTTREDRLAEMLRRSVQNTDQTGSIDCGPLQMARARAQMLLHRLRFPLLQRSRTELVHHARNANTIDLLLRTWSCWFPRDEQACQRCPDCQRRSASLANSMSSRV